MIRKATRADFSVMLEMAEKFIAKAWAGIADYDAFSCAETLEQIYSEGILLITEDRKGMIGVMVHPWHFNREVLTATELVWWSEGKGGGDLRKTAEALAREAGAKSFNMSRMDGMRDAALDRLYRADGYRANEHVYIKELA